MPPGTGICHQVNLEYLSRVVFATDDGQAYCDTLVGTDSHTTMVNGLGVLGWGVGGIEAEAAMLGQPLSLLLPPVVGFRLTGEQPAGTTATDLVLTITHLLRQHGVVGKFVEFYGPGVAAVPLANRATIGNMSPEYGATCAIFPIDEVTLDYLRFTGRDDQHVDLVEAYAKEQGMFHVVGGVEPVYSETIELDLSTVVPSIAGPARPQDLVTLAGAGTSFRAALGRDSRSGTASLADGSTATVEDGAVVVAAITSCTNTSNPQVMVAAGLVAERAVARGLAPKPWVKTTLAPGSRVVMDYLDRAGLTEPLAAIGFDLVGYGCTTCIGNSGPLLPGVSEAVHEHDLSVASVLSGNRNFEGRIHPDVRMNYLASPPLVVAYALAGTMDIDLSRDPLGTDADGRPVLLADLWPSPEEVAEAIRSSLTSAMFRQRYGAVFDGDERWQAVATATGTTFDWDRHSTYVLRPTFLEGLAMTPEAVTEVTGARVLAQLGDSVTTDHISPAGTIGPTTPAGRYLADKGVERTDFNSYGARRGNHEVMVRGTFANVRLRNQLAPGTEGGITLHLPDGEQTTIYEAARALRRRGRPAGGAGRQGVRLGVVPRLGGQGDRTARDPGRHRRELRADPPVQPDRHGSAAPAVRRGHERRITRAHRTRGLLRDRARPAQRRRDAEDGRPCRPSRGSGWWSSRPACASTHRWRPSTTATGGSSPTCCARWPAEQPAPSRTLVADPEVSRPAAGRTRR